MLVPWLGKAAVERMTPEDQTLYLRAFIEQVAPIFEEWRKPHRIKCAYGGRGSGAKCLKKGTLVWMYNGELKPIESLVVGDKVMGPDSLPRNVLSTSSGFGPLYKVHQAHAIDYVVNENHILTLKKAKYCKKDKGMFMTKGYRRPRGAYPDYPEIVDIPIQEYLLKSGKWKECFNGFKPGVIRYRPKPLKVDPYFLGAWLGDGSSREVGITSMDAEIVEYFRNYCFSFGLKERVAIKTNANNKAKTYTYTMGNNGNKNPNKLLYIMRDMGVINNKHIPNEYMINSEQNRLELLAGLIDTDGNLRGNLSGYTFAQSKYPLARQVKQLADSLGFKTSLIRKDVMCNGRLCEAYKVNIGGDIYRIPCKLPRKIVTKEMHTRTQDPLVTYVTVSPDGEGEWFGIETDGDHRFLLEDGTVTHNSRSSASLLIQFAERKELRILCVRDVQKSIAESSWRTLRDELERLGYVGWNVTREKIENTKNGSYFVFNGLNDMTAASLKSYESFDILFAEEGAPISRDAWLTMLATFRKPTSEIWCLFNRELEHDPCYDLFCRNPEPDWSILKCRPGNLDNPWFDQTTLPKEWERLKAVDPDEARHVYEGYPRAQSDKAIFSRNRVLAMFERPGYDEGAVEIGCDVARFGKDYTVAYKRKGMRVIDRYRVQGYDTVAVAGGLWEFAGHDPKVIIKVDAGYNPGVIDVLASYGAGVQAIGFGESAQDPDKYPNKASEMYFELPVDEIGIPSEYMTDTLIEDLTERLFSYDQAGRRKIESKDTTSTAELSGKTNFKARHSGRSPDEGDALVLTFITGRDWTMY